MAITRLILSSIFVLSMLVIATATDYGYTPKPTSNDDKPQDGYPNDYAPKPNSLDLKLKSSLNVDYVPKPKSQTPTKPSEAYLPKPQPQTWEKSSGQYVSENEEETPKKPTNVYIPKPEPKTPKKSNNGYVPNPEPETPKKPTDVYIPKPEPETPKKPSDVYIPKPEPQTPKNPSDVYIHKLEPKSPKKPIDVYIPKPELETPKKPIDVYIPKPEPEMKKETKTVDQYVPKPEKPLPIGIEGLVLCKSGSKYTPIKGAVARITCSILGHEGYEATPFSCLTSETDEKGFFYKTLADLGVDKMLMLTDCRVKLEKSPLQNCNVPTNVNKGITGALLSSFQILHDKKIKLYPVGPFFYVSHSQSESTPTPAAY